MTQATQTQPFSAQFAGAPLPRELRAHADSMSWAAFTATYSPTAGPLRLGTWGCGGADLGRRLGSRPYRATLAIGGRIETATAEATGPVAALTAMLYERGIALETLRFHQLKSDGHTATFVQGSDGLRAEWAMGWSQDATESALRAVIACANRLLTA